MNRRAFITSLLVLPALTMKADEPGFVLVIAIPKDKYEAHPDKVQQFCDLLGQANVGWSEWWVKTDHSKVFMLYIISEWNTKTVGIKQAWRDKLNYAGVKFERVRYFNEVVEKYNIEPTGSPI